MSAAATSAASRSAWTDASRSRLLVAVAVAATAVTGSWYCAAGSNDPGDQVVFVTLALLGVVLELASVSLWLGEGRRTARALRQRLLAAVAEPGPDPSSSGAAVPSALVARPEGRWIHRADCAFIVGRQLEQVMPARGNTDRRPPCPACRP